MLIEIGHVEAIFRYPVKSMRGESLEAANLGWHGLDGDRRLAFRRLDDRSGFPWLTAGKLPDLVLFAPQPREDNADLPTHVRTPAGDDLPVFGEALAAEVAASANAGAIATAASSHPAARLVTVIVAGRPAFLVAPARRAPLRPSW